MPDDAEELAKSDGDAIVRPNEVWFRKSFLARQMVLPPGGALHFDRVGERAGSVGFANIKRDAEQDSHWSPSVRCTGTVCCSVPRRCSSFYGSLWSGRMPAEAELEHLQIEPGGSPDPVFCNGHVPAFLTEALAPIEAELEQAVSRVVGLTRWRCNRTGPVGLPALSTLEWSMDGIAWKLDVRRPTMGRTVFGPDLVVSDARRADIESLIARGDHEPIHQSLLREAESLLESNPRSALVVSATAAELAIKALVSTHAAQTSWLIQNLPSPPIAKIVEEYLPRILPAGSPKFASELIRGLKAAVTLRNELVHGARTNIEANRFTAAFKSFQDVVWLCDYLSGMPWALNRVSRATLTAMNLAPTVDNSGWFVD